MIYSCRLTVWEVLIVLCYFVREQVEREMVRIEAVVKSWAQRVHLKGRLVLPNVDPMKTKPPDDLWHFGARNKKPLTCLRWAGEHAKTAVLETVLSRRDWNLLSCICRGDVTRAFDPSWHLSGHVLTLQPNRDRIEKASYLSRNGGQFWSYKVTWLKYDMKESHITKYLQ